MKTKSGNDYDYIYHQSQYRPEEKRWACIHREDLIYYFGKSKFNVVDSDKLRVYFGKTQKDSEAMKDLDTTIGNSHSY